MDHSGFRVGIVFSGGPAPGANSVIAATSSAFRRAGATVIGFRSGYTHLQSDDDLQEGEHYFQVEDHHLWGLRNNRGVFLGTGHANPALAIYSQEDLQNEEKNHALVNVYHSLKNLDIHALVSIGGDGTLKMANCLYEYQSSIAEKEQRIRIVHVPKAIDNDYAGIDFTFGFFTAVDVMAKELQNLRADAVATQSYFIVETMGRSAGWLAYGVAVAGEAHLVLAAEDLDKNLLTNNRLDLHKLSNHIVDLISTRETRGKKYGTVVLAEGLAEYLPDDFITEASKQSYVNLNRMNLAGIVASSVTKAYAARFGKPVKVTGLQLGYESRCAPPHAFDVLLGSQLGLGAYRAISERKLDGHMISAAGQLELRYVPFADIVDKKSLKPRVRLIDRKSDFFYLASELGTRFESK